MTLPLGDAFSGGRPDAAAGLAVMEDAEFRVFTELAAREMGATLNESKRQLVTSRLQKRLRVLGLNTFREYRQRLFGPPLDREELVQFINVLTTNKTDFFREPHHFAFLAERALTEWLARQSGGTVPKFRVWCAASSTGEEPYSIAATLRQAQRKRPGWDFEIVASDIDTEVLKKAEAGVYGADKLEQVPEELRSFMFLRGKGEAAGLIKVRPELQSYITFRRLNLTLDDWGHAAPYDLIFCRNVIIYFDRATQDVLFRRMWNWLKPGGYLLLGHSENLGWMSELYQGQNGTVYQRLGGDGRKTVPLTAAPAEPQAASGNPAASRQAAPAEPRPLRTAAPPPPNSSLVTVGQALPPARTRRAVSRSIIVGEIHVANDDEPVRTLLGSCVAACLYDPVTRIGGMNHFLLPDNANDEEFPMRYGVHAMEMLINRIMKLGGDRRRLMAKVFGAAHVLRSSLAADTVPTRNAAFIRQFLSDEGIPIQGERLGGNLPIEVHFHPASGRAFARALESDRVKLVAREEESYLTRTTRAAARPPDDSLTIF